MGEGMWDKYGRSGLEQQPHCRPTIKLKEEVIRIILEKTFLWLMKRRIKVRLSSRLIIGVKKDGLFHVLLPFKRLKTAGKYADEKKAVKLILMSIKVDMAIVV